MICNIYFLFLLIYKVGDGINVFAKPVVFNDQISQFQRQNSVSDD